MAEAILVMAVAKAKAKPNPAVASYLLTLREKRKLSQQVVADQVGVSDRQVSNWEKGENSPRSASLPKLLKALGGDYADVEKLTAMKNAAPKDGAALAQWRIAQAEVAANEDPEINAIRQKILSLPPEKLRALGPIADQLSQEPE